MKKDERRHIPYSGPNGNGILMLGPADAIELDVDDEVWGVRGTNPRLRRLMMVRHNGCRLRARDAPEGCSIVGANPAKG